MKPSPPTPQAGARLVQPQVSQADHSSHILPEGSSGPLAAARSPFSPQHAHCPKGFCFSLFLKMTSVEREGTKVS